MNGLRTDWSTFSMLAMVEKLEFFKCEPERSVAVRGWIFEKVYCGGSSGDKSVLFRGKRLRRYVLESRCSCFSNHPPIRAFTLDNCVKHRGEVSYKHSNIMSSNASALLSRLEFHHQPPPPYISLITATCNVYWVQRYYNYCELRSREGWSRVYCTCRMDFIIVILYDIW